MRSVEDIKRIYNTQNGSAQHVLSEVEPSALFESYTFVRTFQSATDYEVALF